MRRFVMLIAPFVGAATVTLINGCGLYDAWFGPDAGIIGSCDDPTDTAYNDIGCIESRCRRDAQVDADDCGAESSSSSGSSARCSGTCVPNEPNGFDDPQPVYFGPAKAKYTTCPRELGDFGGIEYFGLNSPSSGCPACICGPIEGSCSPPTTITAHAGMCGAQQAPSTDFSGPENWDGSCTNVHAIPAGSECPAGSGALCAQSVTSSPLPPPAEGCEPIPLPIPKATSDTPWWSNIVLSCSPSALHEECEDAASTTCLPALPADETGWRYCVRAETPGNQPCPEGWGSKFTQQLLGYKNYVDTRKCSECKCDASGGTCYGTLRVYKDDSCSTNEFFSTTLSSDATNCDNLFPPGEALGSKEVTDLMYVPGKCEPSGGVPTGTVELDTTNIVTWCCLKNGDEASAM